MSQLTSEITFCELFILLLVFFISMYSTLLQFFFVFHFSPENAFGDWSLVYTPSTLFTTELMATASKQLNMPTPTSCRNASAMEGLMMSPNTTFFAGVEFHITEVKSCVR